jgi:CRP-like cAMP-binding protein
MLRKLTEAIPEWEDPPDTVVYAPSTSCPDSCRLFDAVSERTTAGRPACGTALEFSRNETIYVKGGRAIYAYKVIEGAVRLSRLFADGRRQIVNFHLPGEIFGFEPSDFYFASAEAVGRVVLLRCPRACMMHFCAADPDINHNRLMMLSKSLFSAERHIAMLGHQSARQRIASFFLTFDMSHPCDGEFAFNLPLGRQDIADYLGLTIETTCRALSDLKRRRIIDTPTRRQVVVRNASILRAIAEGLAV